MSYSKPGDERYTAAWNPGEAEVTVVIDRYAGVSGPGPSFPATSRADAAKTLFTEGYLTGGDWTVTSHGTHWVSLTRMR